MSLRRHAFVHLPFLRALLVSLIGHGVLLVGVAVPLALTPPTPVGETRVQVSVRAPAAATGRAAEVAAASPSQRAVPLSEARRRPADAVLPTPAPRTPVSVSAPAPVPLLAPAAESSIPVRARVATAEPPSVVPPSGATTVGERASAQAVAAGGEGGRSGTSGAPAGVSADDVRHYRVALASAARRFKRYPALARERGWEGTVEVAVLLRASLPRPEVKLQRSSGRDLLDVQALEMVTQAVGVADMPAALHGRDLRIDLPVRFSLDDER